MKKHIYKAFAKKLFGARYERLGKTVFTEIILFYSLHITGLQVRIAPSVLYLMTTVFTAGIMWQALSSSDHAGQLKHMLTLPFVGKEFISGYVGMLGLYTLITKTTMLWSAVFAVSDRNLTELIVSVLCALNGVFLPSLIFVLLRNMDAYRFFLPLHRVSAKPFYMGRPSGKQSPWQPVHAARLTPQKSGCAYMWKYFFRYLTAHKNYLVNTAAMCGIACVLPLLFGNTEPGFILPIGLGILSMNTPLCTLLSCAPSLNQAVRFLPGQKRLFCVSYCVFIFGVNLSVDIIFLLSLAARLGSLGMDAFLMAVFFALQGAVGSVWLEWSYPIKNWKIESDLWHHPRKYIVPASLVLIAGLLGTVPWFLYILYGILGIEILAVRCSFEG